MHNTLSYPTLSFPILPLKVVMLTNTFKFCDSIWIDFQSFSATLQGLLRETPVILLHHIPLHIEEMGTGSWFLPYWLHT